MSFSDPNRGFHAGLVLDEEASRQIIKKALDQIRGDVGPYGVEIPEVPEVDSATEAVH